MVIFYCSAFKSFFELETIDNFVIYLRMNEVINVLNDVVDVTDNYYGKNLTNLIPQKNPTDLKLSHHQNLRPGIQPYCFRPSLR